MLQPAGDFDRLRADFRWQLPDRYNIGHDVCDVWALRDPQRPAILARASDGRLDVLTYGAMRERSNRVANLLRALGVRRFDRVAIILPQSFETAFSHIGVYKLAAVALPLAALFGVDALEYRLNDAGAKVVITNAAGVAKLKQIRALIPGVETILSIDGADGEVQDFHGMLARQPTDFTVEDTGVSEPAMMIYTSGTTGPPKGALHGHRVLLGHLPGIQVSHEFLPQPGDLMWTPADWAWAGGLLNMLLPALKFGLTVVAGRNEKFDPEAAFAMMAALKVRNAFIPPTALKMMRDVANPRGRFALDLRTIGSAGEALGAETYIWAREALGMTVNEFYGQTECNYVLGSCGKLGVSKAGFIGKALPGHEVAILRGDGTLCEPMEQGQIAVRAPDPVMFLEYWNNPQATAGKFLGEWMTTGDQGIMDAEGYVHFVGRDDDVITSAGYRIGPGEIEDCLLKHPAIALAAAVGKPDPVRTEIVKAFVVLKSGHVPSDALDQDIRAFVRGRLSAHEYPREIAFVEALPLTTSGKIIRRILRDQG